MPEVHILHNFVAICNVSCCGLVRLPRTTLHVFYQLYSKLHNWVHRGTGCCTYQIKGGNSNHAIQSHNIILHYLNMKSNL